MEFQRFCQLIHYFRSEKQVNHFLYNTRKQPLIFSALIN